MPDAPNDTGVQPTVPNIPQSPLTEKQGVEALTALRQRTAQATPAASAEQPKAAEAAAPTDSTVTDDTGLLEVATEGGVDPGTEVTDATPVAPETVVFVDENGKPVTAEEARKSHFRQQDYSQKTETLARLTEVTGTRQALVDQAASFYAARIPTIMQFLDSMIPAEPDENLRNTDSNRYWDQKNARRDALALRQKLDGEWNAVKGVHNEINGLSAEQRQIEQSQKLLEAIPAWRNPAIAAKERPVIAEYARSVGYSNQELSQADFRAVRVLRDAELGARVRKAGGLKPTATTKPTPTIPANATAGIDSSPTTKVPPANLSASRPAATVDQSASRRTRFAQGVGVLSAARRRG